MYNASRTQSFRIGLTQKNAERQYFREYFAETDYSVRRIWRATRL